jgi:hypothetical protein
MAGGWAVGEGFSNAQTYGTDTSVSGLNGILSGGSLGVPGFGSWTQITSATSYDSSWALFFVDSAGGGSTDAVVSFALGSSGSEHAVLSDLTCNWWNATMEHMLVPMSIPAGTRISAQVLSNIGNNIDVFVGCILFDTGFTDLSWGSAIDTIGYNATTFLGTPLVSSTSNGTPGSWTQLSSSTAYDYVGVMCSVDTNNTAATGITGYPTILLDIAVGTSGSEQIIISGINAGFYSGSTTTQLGCTAWTSFMFTPIKAGSRVSARVNFGKGSPQTCGLTLYGVR